MRGALVLAALVSLGGCRKSELDNGKLVASIKNDLGKQLGVPFDAVDCPGGRKLKKGDKFTCTGKAAGLPIPIEVEQMSADGEVHMRVRGIVVVKKVTDQVEQQYKAAGQAAQVDCGVAPLRALAQGDGFDCTISAAEKVVIRVTATDDYGGTHYEPKK
jgi:hypothetical protein